MATHITEEQEQEFNRIADCVRTQGDIDCLLNLIPDEAKIDFINSWHEGDEENG